MFEGLKGQVDLSTLVATLSATGAMLLGFNKFIERIEKAASAKAEAECEQVTNHIQKAIRVCGEEIDDAYAKQDYATIARLRRVQNALTEKTT